MWVLMLLTMFNGQPIGQQVMTFETETACQAVAQHATKFLYDSGGKQPMPIKTYGGCHRVDLAPPTGGQNDDKTKEKQ